MPAFIAADGYLDNDAVNLLNKEIAMYVRKYKIDPTKTIAVHMVRRTMKPYAKDLSERQINTRVQMVKPRKSFPKLGTKCAIILAVYKDEAFQEDFKKEIRELEKAIEIHNKKAEKALAGKKEANAKVREQNSKKLEKLIKELDSVAAANDMQVETIFSTTGKSYLLEIDGNYLSIGLATPTAIAKIGMEAPKPGAGLAASRAKKPAAPRKPAPKIIVRESSKVIEKPARKAPAKKAVAETPVKKTATKKAAAAEPAKKSATKKVPVKTAKVVAATTKKAAKTPAKTTAKKKTVEARA